MGLLINTMYALKEKLKRKELTIGSWISIDNEITAEIMAKSGFEWLVIDREHTTITTEGMFRLIQIISLANKPVLVRIGANDPLLIKQAMDAGASGIVVPMVNTPDDARQAVESVYYPPRGKRGVGLFRAQGYGDTFQEYMSQLDNTGVVIVQIEHYEAVQNLEEILAVEGVDGFMIGPYDLSGSINLPGQFDDPRVQELLRLVEQKMAQSAKPGGYHIVRTAPTDLEKRIAAGYTFIAYGVDMIMFSEKVSSMLQSTSS